MAEPKRNVAYTFYISLPDSAVAGSYKANPTIAAGDFKVSTDGSAFANLATLPSVDPAGSIGVKVDLSAAEMDGDKIMVQGIDAVGNEWSDVFIFIETLSEAIDANIIEVLGDTVAPVGLRDTYNGVGYSDPVGPAQQQQVTHITSGSSGIASASVGATVVTGTETNDYTFTKQRDGLLHQITDIGGVIDVDYEFYIGSTGVPSSITFYGRVSGNGDDIKVHGYDYVLDAWQQIGTITGKNTATLEEFSYPMLNTYVGAGVDAGKVRVRFENTGLSSANIYIDQLYTSFAVVASPVGYANGAVWIDTINGTAGTVVGVNGVADLPSNSIEDALAIAVSAKLKRFQIAPNSLITFVTDMTGFVFIGEKWTLALGGQNITNVYIWGALITGIATGTSNPVFDHCRLGSITTIPFSSFNTGLTGTITITAAGDIFLEQCYSGVAGPGSPVWDFGVAVGSINLNIRHFSGGNEFQNMGQLGTDTVSLEGDGQFIVNANCVGGEIHVRGSFKKTDNSAGAVIINEEANIKTNVIHDGYARASTVNTVQLATSASSVDGAYDPAEIFIVNGKGAGQTRLIYQYVGATRMCILDRDWKVLPDITSECRVISNPGREHVNEGQARGGTTNSIILNVNASSINNAYKDQMVFIRSGTGEDQVGVVDSYDGITKEVIIRGTFPVPPDNTSGYAMLPVQYTNYLVQLVEGTITLEEALRLMLSVMTGKSSGGGSDTLKFRDILDTKDRLVATVDPSGNRTAITTRDGS